jgi:hypothetical protein
MKVKPVFFLLLFSACHGKEITAPLQTTLFDSHPSESPVSSVIKEASGIADSKAVPQTLWVEEDSGNPPQLYSLNYDGSVRKKVYIKGATNHDWEDMALSDDSIYIAETGDNNLVRLEYAIYKFPEPTADVDTVYGFEKVRFQYPDGSHNAEAILVDPVTKDILIITKSDSPARIYKIAYPYSNTLNTAIQVGQLTYDVVTGAALSPDGKEIIVRTYSTLYHYNCDGRSILAALQTAPTSLPYTMEPQGEAVGFTANNSGFFTLSERGFSSSVNLYFYKRL